jgi:dipeptidyl aminopeptidase/acylaminoacyl peptidase
MTRILLFLLFLNSTFATAQNVAKKTLDHADFDLWNTIDSVQLSNDGRWVAYELNPGEGDGKLHLYDATTGKTQTFPRGKNARFSADSRHLVFKIKPLQDTLKAQRRRKVKREDLPKDSLGMIELVSGKITKIPEVQSFQLPDQWNWLAYWKEPEISKADSIKTDSTAQKRTIANTKKKKESKDNGSKLVLQNLTTGAQTEIPFVKNYTHAKKGATFLLASTGNDSAFQPGVYVFDAGKATLQPILNKKGEYKNLTLDESGTQAAFLADFDTTKAQVKPVELYVWKQGTTTQKIADHQASFLPKTWRVSENGALRFSKDGSKLFFGMAPKPILKDTTLLEEEIVSVEVWNVADPRMHTQQKVLLEQEQKRTYQVVYHFQNQQFVALGNENLPEIRTGDEGNAPVALGFNENPYLVETTWEGGPARKDVYLVNMADGGAKLVGTGISGTPFLSPNAKYVLWYNPLDSNWTSYNVAKGTTQQITNNKAIAYFDELNDVPARPNSYGVGGWFKDDAAVLIYDRFDIWKIDPAGATAPVNLTNSRKGQKTYRYLALDREKRFLEPTENILLSVFEEPTKKAGYVWLDLKTNTFTELQFGNYSFDRPLKAKNAEKYVFTRENFNVFPDLLYSNDLKTFKQISTANPQQKNYNWGSVELVEWTSLDGQKLQGILAKPDNFDPKKQYPMIVNFYERSSEGLYQHRAPYPHRSQINYTFYTSRGYLVFNPDIPYRIGYPGESAYNAVVSGTTALIDKGFVNRNRVALQGHSWGGYQIAYIITRTNMFRCAESGAPVVNMISAYGGIRWESGLSRAFQYERSQSRIGGSPWTYPLRYLENSPIFTMDKVNTPVLILHNDKDGAVPWYQGIEFFTAMRRLGKPAWLLNYNDEPHWPVKPQNRKDFQKRMQQFFDHYLLDKPMPQWMKRGVPAMEKGILQGLELLEETVGSRQ